MPPSPEAIPLEIALKATFFQLIPSCIPNALPTTWLAIEPAAAPMAALATTAAPELRIPPPMATPPKVPPPRAAKPAEKVPAAPLTPATPQLAAPTVVVVTDPNAPAARPAE